MYAMNTSSKNAIAAAVEIGLESVLRDWFSRIEDFEAALVDAGAEVLSLDADGAVVSGSGEDEQIALLLSGTERTMYVGKVEVC